jgi:hypothetical protein
MLPKVHVISYRVANVNTFTGDCRRGCGIVFDGENGEMNQDVTNLNLF